MTLTSHRLPERYVKALERRIAGEIIRPGDDAYDEAHRVWNGMSDRYSAVIIRCTSENDVIAAVEFARAAGVPMAVRGGGHTQSGKALIYFRRRE